MSQEIIAQKEQQVQLIKEKAEKAKGIVIVDYRGLSVLQDTELRNELRANNVEYKVLKNSLVLRAMELVGYKGMDEVLKGPTAVAFSYDDPVAPAKVLATASAKFNKMSIKGGIVEGKIVDENGVKALSKIPAKPVLVGQLLGMLTHPMRSLAVAMSEIAKKQEA